MWAFLSGVKKPAQNKRNYEENRKERSFKVSWTAGRQWLQYKDGKMFCTFCKEAGVISDFCRGSTSFRIDSVKKHENSDSHKHSTVVATNKTKEPGTRPAEKALQNLNKENVKKLEILFKTAHALAKNNRPYSDFEWICGLDVAKGLVLGTTYITDKYCRKFVNAIAEVERNRTKEAVEKVKFLSILCDGSTDQGIIDNEIVYLRMVVQGKAEVKFIGCMQVTKADARGVFHAMKRAVEGVGLDWSKTLKKMVGLGSDGAAVMTGKKAGVAALLKQQHPSIISIHCLAHRLELAYKDALKGIKIGEKVVSGLLLGLYYFYHNSPLNRANLKESYKTLGIDMKMPTRVGGTRWVGHVLLALKNMFHGYAAIKQHLYQLAFGSGVQAIAKSKALGLYKILVDDNNITFAAFLLDILSLLHIMSQVFQREESCVADIHRALNSCLSSLNRFSEIDGAYLTKLKSGDMGPVVSSANLASFSKARTTLLDNLKMRLAQRFEDANIGVVKSSIIVDFKCWPEKDSENKWEDFGDEHIKTAADHFQQDLETAGLDADDVFHEWVFLKSDIYGSFPDVHELSWPQVQRQLNGYENIFGLIDLLLTLPSSSSECERGFSQMKKIKTDSRTRLTEASLDDLLTVSLHSDAIDKFDPIPAINKWVHGAVAKRRPQFNDKKRKQQTQGQQEREKRQRTEETIEIIDAETQSESVERESQSEDVEGESESAEGERTLEDSRGDNEEETDEEMNGEIDEDEGSEIDSENDLSEERVNEIILNFEKEIEREMQ